MALEERIGNVSTGLSEETIMKLLKHKKYSVEEGSQVEAEPCCVCQVNQTGWLFLLLTHECTRTYMLKHMVLNNLCAGRV